MRDTRIEKQFTLLSDVIDTFIQEVQKKKLSLMATDKWTVKELLCHITSWHEYYAANYKALSEGVEPPLYEGSTTKRNLDTVRDLKNSRFTNLVQRLQKAHMILEKSIIEGKVKKMTYKKNGRIYTTPDFLDMVTRHINTHTQQIKRAK